MANSVCWHVRVLGREDGDVLRGALKFEVEGQREKGRSNRTLKWQVAEGSTVAGLSG